VVWTSTNGIGAGAITGVTVSHTDCAVNGDVFSFDTVDSGGAITQAAAGSLCFIEFNVLCDDPPVFDETSIGAATNQNESNDFPNCPAIKPFEVANNWYSSFGRVYSEFFGQGNEIDGKLLLAFVDGSSVIKYEKRLVFETGAPAICSVVCTTPYERPYFFYNIFFSRSNIVRSIAYAYDLDLDETGYDVTNEWNGTTNTSTSNTAVTTTAAEQSVAVKKIFDEFEFYSSPVNFVLLLSLRRLAATLCGSSVPNAYVESIEFDIRTSKIKAKVLS